MSEMISLFFFTADFNIFFPLLCIPIAIVADIIELNIELILNPELIILYIIAINNNICGIYLLLNLLKLCFIKYHIHNKIIISLISR